MIPRTVITAWREHHAPWAGDDQVEQDLILSRVLLELYSDKLIAESLAFRGGTALNKLFLAQMSRYSEDIDLVQINSEPIGNVMTRIRTILTPWLGKPRYKQSEGRVTFYFKYMSEPPIEKSMKIKIEINTREHHTLFGHENRPFALKSDWIAGQCNIKTYTLEELLGTKLRALYQRRKGRDLFDLWICKTTMGIDCAKVAECFLFYMEQSGLKISRADFEENLLRKLSDASFRDGTQPLLRPGTKYDVEEAGQCVLNEFISQLPGESWKGLSED